MARLLITLDIGELDNDAFADDEERYEIARILTEATDTIGYEANDGIAIENLLNGRLVRDFNGNTVGMWHVDRQTP
jgi:hypothetical protein